MSHRPKSFDSEFDIYAENYATILSQGLAVSGESANYFAAARGKWLADCLARLGAQPRQVMDFGCGTGSATPFLLRLHEGCSLVGVEVSARSLREAQRIYRSARTRFTLARDYLPAASVDLVFCNGVFHHISGEERAAAVSFVFRSLRPGGLFSFWENNPWNPGTHYVMSRIPFDRDAIKVSPLEARRLLRSGGFEVLETDFLFYFPRFLCWLRKLEGVLTHLPFGAQYQVLCRKRD